MIYLITGRPGEGKGIVAAFLARALMRTKRTVYADFYLAGARPWLSFEDCLTPPFAGAAFFADEVGATLNSRATLNLDPLVFTALTMHRHNQVDLYLTAQDELMVDVQVRRLCSSIITCERIGPGGESYMTKRLQGRINRPARLYERPWAVSTRWYRVERDSSGEPKRAEREYDKQWIWCTRSLMSMFDTTQMIISASLRSRWVELCATADIRALMPEMKRGLGRPDLAGVVIPERVTAREAAREALQATVDDVVLSRGFYDDGLVDEVRV